MKITKEDILKEANARGQVRTMDFVARYGVSRQYIARLFSQLVDEGRLVKIGGTHSAFYVLPQGVEKYVSFFSKGYTKTFLNTGLEEHRVFQQVEQGFPPLTKLSENVKDIFFYGFSEMMNNAIEHSQSKKIRVKVEIKSKMVFFEIRDWGIGVFRNIMKARRLYDETEAMQDLLKGKITTMPKSHSGEGIFFTSKAADFFELDSFGHQLTLENQTSNILWIRKKENKGTRVAFGLSMDSSSRLTDVFRKYADMPGERGSGFDKTEIRVRLYARGGAHISRSQARRILSGLEKFRVIVLDFDQVSVVGQGFVDEIFRVFQNARPHIQLRTVNMNKNVRFMIERLTVKNKNVYRQKRVRNVYSHDF